MINRDKIDAMDNHELAKVLNTSPCDFCAFSQTVHCGYCVEGIEEWLKRKADEDD